MPRKGENIYKRKDGRWEGRYIREHTANGKIRYGYVYAHSYKEVRQQLSLRKKDVDGQSSAGEKNDGTLSPASAEFSAITEEWLVYIKPRVKESSYIKYRNLTRSYLLPKFGCHPTEKISSDDIDAFCRDLLSHGGKQNTGLSAKTVSDILSVTKSVLLFTEKKKGIRVCDCKDVTIKKDSKELVILSRNSQKTLLDFITSDMNGKNLGIVICLCTGLRIGEVCALRWEDISFGDQILYVHQTMQRIQNDDPKEKKKTKITITPPKSPCSIRHIPISDYLLQILQNPVFSHQGYVLTGDQNKFVEPRAMEYHFRKTLEKCNIDYVNFHVLRHTFATRCVEVGFDVKSLSEILGHASVAITMNRYVHPSMELKRENMQKLSDIFAVK